MNVFLLTPDEAATMVGEFRSYCAYGPPYTSPNADVLKSRDDAVIRALRARSLRESATRSQFDLGQLVDVGDQSREHQVGDPVG